MSIEYKINVDPNLLKKINDDANKLLPKTSRFFAALFQRRAKDEARKHTKGGRFWHSIADSIVTDNLTNGISVGATHTAAGHKHTGGMISAPGRKPGSRNAQHLTIPIDDEAKGKNVNDFRKQDLLFLKSRKGNKIIFKKLSNGDIKPLYVLKKAVSQRPEPWFPFEKANLDLEMAIEKNLKFERN